MNLIITHKTDLMRRLLHLVSHGYDHWISGEIPPAKVEGLAFKFLDRYHTGRTEIQRFRAKQKGEANTQLVMWQDQTDKKSPVHWWLLATKGNGLVHELEKLATVSASRPTLTGYELVMTNRKRRDKDKPDKKLKPGWTWRMTAETFEAWKERLKTAVRHNSDNQIRQALHSLGGVPGFRECRVQAYLLVRILKNDWKRTQQGEFPYPDPFIKFCGKHRKAKTITTQEASEKARRKPKKPAIPPSQAMDSVADSSPSAIPAMG